MLTRRLHPRCFPRRFALLAACWFALLGVALTATPVRAAFPTSRQEQAAWLGDVYAAGLREHYPQGLSEQSIAATRQAFVAGLENLLAQPLTARQVSELTPWVCQSSPLWESDPPLELELLDWRANLLQMIALYLARPPLQSPEGSKVMYQALGQLGDLFDGLRQALVAEFADLPEAGPAEQMAAAAVFSAASIVTEAARSPVSPFAKRLLTEDEVATLREQAREFASGARRDWVEFGYPHYQYRLQSGAAADPLSPPPGLGSIGGAVGQFEGVTRLLYYRPPEVLTTEQKAAVREYHHNLWQEQLAAQRAAESEMEAENLARWLDELAPQASAGGEQ